MSERRVKGSHTSEVNGARIAYAEPTAEWHDLRVITLGGTDGDGDSGAGVEVQLPPGVTHYDETDEDFDNYV